MGKDIKLLRMITVGIPGKKTVFGTKAGTYNMNLMRGIIIRVRTEENMKTSQNVLIAMLEKLLSQISADEKKHILAAEYGMIMTAELEGRIQTICNWAQGIAEINFEQGMKQGIKQGIEQERFDNLKRMLRIFFFSYSHNIPTVAKTLCLCGFRRFMRFSDMPP